MSWTLRYAPHLGYRPPFEPLFTASAGADPVAQVRFAAAQGFAGVLYAAARMRAEEEQAAVGAALAAHGLEAGCILYTRFERLRDLSWVVPGAAARGWIMDELRAAADAAHRVGARRLAVLAASDPDRPLGAQRATFVEHLRQAADFAQAEGLTLCLETLSRRSIEHMLLQHMPDALALVRELDHPAVRLIFDTSHVRIMDGDVLGQLEQAYPYTAIVQLADDPGRLEPGSGSIDFEALLRFLARRGFAGLVELEHGWSRPGPEAERRGLDLLRRLDAAAARDSVAGTPRPKEPT